MNYLSFPGLGIGPFQINDTAFTVFGLDIKWYGIIITVGMILAYFYARTRAKYEGITEDDLYEVTISCVIFGVIGARLYYVLFKLKDFIVTDGSLWDNIKNSFIAIVNIRNGGLAIYGGLLAGVLTLLIFAKIKRIHFPVLLDVAAPAAMIGQIVGRWGNFINIEAYGRATVVPWRMSSRVIAEELFNKRQINYEAYSQIIDGSLGVHPTFLYESVWNLIGFALIAVFYKKKRFNGQVCLFYGAWYGLGRAMIEGLRTDSLMLGSIRVSQLLAGMLFVLCTFLFVYFTVKTPEILKLMPVDGKDAENSGATDETDGDHEDESDADSAEIETESKPEIDSETEGENENGEAD